MTEEKIEKIKAISSSGKEPSEIYEEIIDVLEEEVDDGFLATNDELLSFKIQENYRDAVNCILSFLDMEEI